MTRATPEALYQRGYEDYQKGYYKRAIQSFQRLREEHPLSPVAILAELGIADAHFSDKEYAEAEMSYTEFINLHPTNENIPYAMYQLGMCHFRQIITIDRDQTETLKAKGAFEKLIARFPRSQFSQLAQDMLRECRKKLCEQELYIAEFYLKIKKNKAALRRLDAMSQEYVGLGFDDKIKKLHEEAKKRVAREAPKVTTQVDPAWLGPVNPTMKLPH